VRCDFEEFCYFAVDDSQSLMPLVAVEAYCQYNLDLYRIMYLCQKHSGCIRKLTCPTAYRDMPLEEEPGIFDCLLETVLMCKKLKELTLNGFIRKEAVMEKLANCKKWQRLDVTRNNTG
jgi:hypothetical protein